MQSFQWSQHYVTGFSNVDDQHQELVNLINRLGKMLAENTINMDEIEDLYQALANYATQHFREEEELMAQANIDSRHVIAHIEEHQRFLVDVNAIYETISPGNLEKAKSFMSFLTHWLAYHILGKDQEMAQQLNKINSGLSPTEAFDKVEQEKVCATEPLLRALNGLFEQVSQRNLELKKLNDSLELRVALRTEELINANKQLEKISFTDALTGLHNRRYAINSLTELWHEARQNNLPLTCIMIDADNFKGVNDANGHDAGDKVLRELASAIRNAIRTDDYAIRMGGDEFVVLCPNTNLQGGINIANTIQKAVAKLKVHTGGKPWLGSISVGVAAKKPGMRNYKDLIKAADSGLYNAKKSGRNCVRTIH